MAAVSLLDKWLLLQVIVADGNLSATARLVAARLLYHHNALTGLCSPSYQTLAEGTALKRRAVINAVQELEGAAWISIERVKGGAASGAARYQINAFRIDFSRAASASTVHGDAPLTVHDDAPLRDDNSAPPCTGGVHGDAPSTVHGGAPESGKRSGKGNREVSPPTPSSFDRWWSTYPKRVGEVDARKAYDRAITKGIATADTLQAGAERYAAQMAAEGRQQQHIKDAAGWINGQRWNDEPAPARPSGLNGASRHGGFSAIAYVAERIADDE